MKLVLSRKLKSWLTTEGTETKDMYFSVFSVSSVVKFSFFAFCDLGVAI